MRSYKSQGDLTILDGIEVTGSSGGGCLTGTFAELNLQLGDFGTGTYAYSPLWYPRLSMNLIQLDLRGTFYNVDSPPGDPILLALLDEYGSSLATVEFANADFEDSVDYPIGPGQFKSWVGSVPVVAGVGLRFQVGGGGAYSGEDYYLPTLEACCFSAWFDSDSGGMLILEGSPSE